MTYTSTPTTSGEVFAGRAGNSRLRPNATVAAFVAAALGLSGCGRSSEPAAELSADEVDFGIVLLGQHIRRSIRVRNTGTTDLQVTDVRPGPQFDAGFDVASTIRDPLAPGQDLEIVVSFAATVQGEFFGTVLIESDAPAADGTSTLEVSLFARAEVSRLAFDPADLSLGNIVIESVGVGRSVLRNEGPTEVVVRAATTDGALVPCSPGILETWPLCYALVGTQDELIAPLQPFRLSPGDEQVVEIRMAPIIAGTKERGGLRVQGCPAPECGVELRVAGLGVEGDFRCSPGIVDFGSRPVGTCERQNVTCENIANQHVDVTGSRLDGATVFRTSAVTLGVVPPGGALTAEVTYCPTRSGQDAAMLEFSTDSPATPRLAIALEGEGRTP